MSQKQAKEKPTPPQESETSSTSDNALLASIIGMLAPMVEFHKRVENAKDEDIRLFWDVRVVRGADTPLFEFTGSSSMTGALSPKQLPLLTAAIQQEVNDKISVPLVGKTQQMVDDLNTEQLRRSADAAAERVLSMKTAKEKQERAQKTLTVDAEVTNNTADAALEMATEPTS
jgi:hypothetical protein